MSINEIISELYSDARIDQCIRRFDPESPEDIKHDLFTVLLTKEKELINRLHTEGTLFYYSIVVARNLVRTERRAKKTVELLGDIQEKVEPSVDTDTLVREFNDMDKEMGTFYFRELIHAIVRHGSQNNVAAITGIPKQSISVHVQRVRDHLKRKLCY